jgi:hypothetical protein
MIPKLSTACYAVKVHISNINILNSVYYAYIHSIMKYRIFWGVNLPTGGRFSLHKRKSATLAGAQPITSSRILFKQLAFHAFINQLRYQ